MVVVLDIEGARSSDFRAGTSPLAELLSCLHVLAEPEHHPESRSWLARTGERITGPLAQELRHHAPLWARYRCRLLYPLDERLGLDLADELDALRTVDEAVFVRLAANAIRGTAFRGAALDDAAGRRDFVQACERRSFSRGELAEALVDDPGRFRERLLDVLERCAMAFFDEEWRLSGPRLHDVASRMREQLRGGAAQALTAVSPTATAAAHPARVSYDKLQSARARVRGRGCLLVPTTHGWPHLILKLDEGLPLVVHFSTGDRTQRRAVTQSLVRARLAALCEPARLELCRHLLSEPITTSELSARTGIGEPQVSRHLRRLREVGLVTSQREGRMVYHRLRPELLLSLGADVLTTVMR